VVRRAVFLALAPLSVVLAADACGPSVSSIYEANVRFEHCYRLDLDERVAPGHRSTCWREWSQRYTYGQTRDRLEYARRRISTLASGDRSRPVLDLTVRDGGTGSTEAPQPTNVHAPPPPMVSTAVPVKSAGAGAPEVPAANKPDAGHSEPPGAACATDCRLSWRACKEECDPEAVGKRGSCKVCDKDYGRCVQRCYK
jgi:hypothetical protein